ncbi:ubiquitin carboxyl-terminal hydrolase 36 isoform X9 [Oncorhynchus keta]|uniref:ubiquitin carboxyl-terminal hydrolase 36 isoform X9 n=1 Tax=Oncorhynchus keta TaxID=8018 RepID=UPI0015FD0C52|nr:ubiquitin carboxyl-terminal hydrolase 36 isoform X9 [Oncorhynchus keta]
MNSPRRDNKSSPVVPPRPSSEEMSNPTAHCLNKENDTSSNSQRTGMMGVMQKVNPFKTRTQVTTSASSTASTATDPVSEKTVDGNVPEVKQNLGMFKGVTQKVNPFRSSTQARKEDPPKDTVDQEKLPEGKQVFQNPGMFTGMMQKVNPFKSTAPTQSIHSDLSSSAGSLAENTTTERQVRKEDPSTDTVDHQATAKLPEAKQNPGMFTGMMQKVNPFKSTAPNQDTQAVHSNLSSSADSLASTGRQVIITDDPLTDCVDHHATEKLPESKPQQNPGMFMGMMQKVNPFKSTTPIQDTQSIHSDLSSSSGSLAESNSSAGKQNPGMFKGMMQKVNPFKSTAPTQTQPSYSDSSSSSDSLSDTGVFSPAENQTVWYTENEATSSVKSGPPPPQENKKRTGTFHIRRILPGALFGSEAKNTDAQPTAQAGLVDVQTLEMAAVPVPGEGNPPDSEDREEGLMDWWQTVEGWETWKESNTFDADEGEIGGGGGSCLHGGPSLRASLQPARGLLTATHPGAPIIGRRRRQLPQEDCEGQRGGRSRQRCWEHHHYHRPHLGAVHHGNVAHRHGGGHRRCDGGRGSVSLCKYYRYGALQDRQEEGGEDDSGLPGGDEGYQGVSGLFAGRYGDPGGVGL